MPGCHNFCNPQSSYITYMQWKLFSQFERWARSMSLHPPRLQHLNIFLLHNWYLQLAGICLKSWNDVHGIVKQLMVPNQFRRQIYRPTGVLPRLLNTMSAHGGNSRLLSLLSFLSWKFVPGAELFLLQLISYITIVVCVNTCYPQIMFRWLAVNHKSYVMDGKCITNTRRIAGRAGRFGIISFRIL